MLRLSEIMSGGYKKDAMQECVASFFSQVFLIGVFKEFSGKEKVFEKLYLNPLNSRSLQV